MYKKRKWSDILTIISGKNQKGVASEDGEYFIYGSGGIIGRANDYLCPANTVIVGRKGTIDHPLYVTEPFWNIDTAFGVVAGEELLPKFLYYFCLQFNFKELDKSTGRPSVSKSDLLKIEMPLPNIEEQTRIVSRIEEVFSELDKGVETLQIIKKQLAVYRQAVLKAAFEGKFSYEWRNKGTESIVEDYNSIVRQKQVFKDTSGDENAVHLEIPNGWKIARLGELFDVQVGATPSRKNVEYWNGTINWISSGEVHFNTIFHSNERITHEGLTHASTNVQPIGTVMLAMIGEGKTRGQAAILKTEAAHNQNTAAILVSETPCSSKYVYYFLQLNYDNTRRVGSGNNQKALNKERVRALRIPFTSFAEQDYIVDEIESRLSVCDSIEQTVDTVLSQADVMRQSILKKAFEGGLN